jgi:hypothetical protein
MKDNSMFLRTSSARNSHTAPAHQAVRVLQFTRNTAVMMAFVAGLITLINADPAHLHTLAILLILRDWVHAAFNL